MSRRREKLKPDIGYARRWLCAVKRVVVVVVFECVFASGLFRAIDCARFAGNGACYALGNDINAPGTTRAPFVLRINFRHLHFLNSSLAYFLSWKCCVKCFAPVYKLSSLIYLGTINFISFSDAIIDRVILYKVIHNQIWNTRHSRA